MKPLLSKIEVLLYRYNDFHTRRAFNLFSILRNSSDEVNLHSKFIFELLNPNGKHGFGNSFLLEFLEIIEETSFDVENAIVLREYKNIDLLIKNDLQAIVIENKIWATDQEKQLERYYKTMEKEGRSDIRLFYLTLDGKEPTSFSLGELEYSDDLNEKLRLISYQDEIRNWIKRCAGLVFDTPPLREALIQYNDLIDTLTGNTITMEERLELINILSEGKNILSAKKIVENWIHVRWHLEWDFWHDLEASLKNRGYSIINLDKYSPQRLDGVYHRRQKQNPWYGLIIEIRKIDEKDTLCLYIERGDGNLYFVINIVRENTKRDICLESKFDNYAGVFQEDSVFGRTKFCLGGKSFENPVNFNNPYDDNTLLLGNKENRAKYIDEMIKDFNGYLEGRGIQVGVDV